MGTLAWCISVLLFKGLPKGGQPGYQIPCYRNDGLLYSHAVSGSMVISPFDSENGEREKKLLTVAPRGILLPVLLITIPLPNALARYLPPGLVSFIQWFSFALIASLLTVPWLFCIYLLVNNSLGRTKRASQILDDYSAPKVAVVISAYKEDSEVLSRAVDSVVNSVYPSSCIHVFLSYDDDLVDDNYLRVINHLGISVQQRGHPEVIDVTYKDTRVTVSRSKHGGKRNCQKRTFKLIDRVYAEYLKRHDDLFILFLDSNCMIDQRCLQNFMLDMQLKPESKHKVLAMTGVVTTTTHKKSLVTLLQDMEYTNVQLFERSVESGCGAVTSLPGALTILRFSAFRNISGYYFGDKAEQCQDLFDYCKCQLGEDRWQTHLLMIGAKESYQIQMCTNAFCKVEVVETFNSLLRQRRRWFLGFVTNEACVLTDSRLWKRYPLLCVIRILQDTLRTAALLFLTLAISVITTSKLIQNLPVCFVIVSLGLNYLLMFYFGARLGRFKMWLYPLQFIISPFLNWLYTVFAIFTAWKRTMGSPRSDATEASKTTTPEEAVERARRQGDELNVNVSTFKFWSNEIEPIGIQPSENAEGSFSTSNQISSGHHVNGSSSASLLTEAIPLQDQADIQGIGRTWSPRKAIDEEQVSFLETDDRQGTTPNESGFWMNREPKSNESREDVTDPNTSRTSLLQPSRLRHVQSTPETIDMTDIPHGYGPVSSMRGSGRALKRKLQKHLKKGKVQDSMV